jgi:hypothetical protein
LRKYSRSFGGTTNTTNLAEGVMGFVGFETSPGSNKGWIKVQWHDAIFSGDDLPDVLLALEWAIEDMGGSIRAGQTLAVPEAGAAALLSLVACGCAGVMALKKLRRKS